ncbi:hypothetical protein trd_1608 [Thermomicrobium roseum DSM 5159]|uniref:Uncharacterized protein n=1 Tax=Thermomicrobium roseum (strain ATCC 27502 / DSM 5159 / P-2) TaxID=309801 RepID=B9L0B6_THERP|nr:hypothetical protein trd_1608 [Thermomicrobium roseum DSM 5159]
MRPAHRSHLAPVTRLTTNTLCSPLGAGSPVIVAHARAVRFPGRSSPDPIVGGKPVAARPRSARWRAFSCPGCSGSRHSESG